MQLKFKQADAPCGTNIFTGAVGARPAYEQFLLMQFVEVIIMREVVSFCSF